MKGEMLGLIVLAVLGMVLIAILGEVILPGSWSCFPDYCPP